jgi:hypothetical protein
MSQEEFREHFEASQSFFIESDHRMEGPTVVIAVPFNMNKRILENLPNTHSSVETTVPGPLKHILGLYGRFLQGVKEISDDYPGQVVLLDPMQDPLYTEHSKGMNKRVLEELGLSGDSRLEIHKIPRHVDRPVYIRDHYMVGKLGENNVVAVSQRELLMGSYISQFQDRHRVKVCPELMQMPLYIH